jgi:hypothetical protein
MLSDSVAERKQDTLPNIYNKSFQQDLNHSIHVTNNISTNESSKKYQDYNLNETENNKSLNAQNKSVQNYYTYIPDFPAIIDPRNLMLDENGKQEIIRNNTLT